jgi:carbamate kinase
MARTLRIFAFGGNEVSPSGMTDPRTGKPVNADIPLQWRRTAETCRAIADIVEKNPGDLALLTHGNGPQVGNILLRAEYARPLLHALPLDVCVADTQSSMGYMIQQLENELGVRGISKPVVTVTTRVVVDPGDPDFKNPSKFIGPSYSREEAFDRRDKDGWAVKLYKKDASGLEIWRRVVPSPEPKDILEVSLVEKALEAGMIPVAAGGGGIPVVPSLPRIENGFEVYPCRYGVDFRRAFREGRAPARVYTGSDAVVDKDLASALLGAILIRRARARGEDLQADLAIFTGEDGAKLNYQKPGQVDLRRLSAAQARELLDRSPSPFPAGSMGPKIRAAIRFAEAGGRAAYITRTELFERTLEGKAGTTITAI